MRQLILTLLLLAGVGSAFTQNLTSAFFVFRNDGPVLPFFYEDVDSIRQSKIDTDSIERPEFVTTEFWTSDSVYRVPIASIDSIAFRTPSEIRKPRSKEISDELLSYLVAVDSLTLKFSPSVPKSILPEKGDKLTYCNSNELLPYGFLGLVKEKKFNENCVVVECDSIGLADAFIRLFQIGKYVSETNTNRQNAPYNPQKFSVKLIPLGLMIVPLPSSIPISQYTQVSKSEGPFDFGFGNDVYAELKYAPVGFYAITLEENSSYEATHVKLYGPATLDINSEFNGSITLSMDNVIKKITLKYPIPTPPIPVPVLNWVLYPELSLTGSIGMKAKKEFRVDVGYECHYSKAPKYKNRLKLLKPTFYYPKDKVEMMSANFTSSAGFFIGIRALEEKLGIDAGASFSVQSDYSLRMDLNEFGLAIKFSDIYRKLQPIASRSTSFFMQPKIKFNMSFSLEIGLNLELYGRQKEQKIFPEFSCPKYIEKNGSGFLSYEIKDDIYLPVIPGIKVVDEEGNTIFVQYDENEYKYGPKFLQFSYLHTQFNKKCTAYPMFKIFNREIMGWPAESLLLIATPVTDDAIAGVSEASLYGHIEVDSIMASYFDSDAGHTVGFCYSTSSGNVKDGKIVKCKLRTDRTFQANISGLNEDTDYYYCAFITTDTITEYGEVRHFYTKEAEEIDLGLSVNWRAWNVGANHLYEYGNHYAWGEKNVKGEYSWSSYFDNPYNGKEWIGCSVDTDISGVYERDASKDLGEDWRMPTREEMQELLDKCEWEWHTVEGVDGYKVTGPSRRSIFLPANGLIDGSSLNNTGTYGAYWTSTPQADTEGKATAATLYFYGGMLKSLQWANRYAGRAVRPVRDKQ